MISSYIGAAFAALILFIAIGTSVPSAATCLVYAWLRCYEQVRRAFRPPRSISLGGWFAHLREYIMFIPIFSPVLGRSALLRLLLVFSALLANRFLVLLLPRQLGIMIDTASQNQGTGIFPWKPVGIYAFYLSCPEGIDFIQQQISTDQVRRLLKNRLASAIFRHLMYLSMDFHHSTSPDELLRAMDQGEGLINVFEQTVFQTIPSLVDLLVASAYAYALFDAYIGIILLSAGASFVWIGTKATTNQLHGQFRLSEAYAKSDRIRTDALNHWETVCNLNSIEHECEQYSASIDAYDQAQRTYFESSDLYRALQKMCMLVAQIAAFTLAIYRVSQGTAQIGSVATLVAHWQAIGGPLKSLSDGVNATTVLLANADKLLRLFQAQRSVVEAQDAPRLHVSGGKVEFRNVDFAYGSGIPIIKNLSFVVQPGETVALVGETGGGKSTILKLLGRHYDTNRGSVLVDDQNIRGATLASLRDSLSLVTQEIAIFNKTVIDNVRYARLSATDEEVRDACRAAAIHTKIEAFPAKYQTVVGERGVRLSGGERQRIAISRAILRDSKILVLDEATSMIDSKTEAEIQDALQQLRGSRTMIVIAHRLSTIRRADCILVLDAGEVVERGSHEELMQQRGRYYGLWMAQDRQIGHP